MKETPYTKFSNEIVENGERNIIRIEVDTPIKNEKILQVMADRMMMEIGDTEQTVRCMKIEEIENCLSEINAQKSKFYP